MAKRGVYVVYCTGDERDLTVTVEGKSVPMDEFIKTHNPIQVTGLTDLTPDAAVHRHFIGLMIAEEEAEPRREEGSATS